MLMQGKKGTIYVTLNNREPTSLDKVLLGSPLKIVVPVSQKCYLQFISIIIHTFDAVKI